LWRASLLRLGEEEYILSLTLHHIVADGWSMGVLVEEFVTLYVAAVSGQVPLLRDLPVQYADYALWQRDWLPGQAPAQQRAHWREQLADLPVLQLPTDHARPAVQSTNGAHLSA